jgi:hypothetical protein
VLGTATNAHICRNDGPSVLARRGGFRHDQNVISVGGWVLEENVAKFLGHLAAYLQTTWDYLDDTALIGAIELTDAEADAWFEYPINGRPPVTVRLALDPGTSVGMVHVTGDLNDTLVARVETLMDLL